MDRLLAWLARLVTRHPKRVVVLATILTLPVAVVASTLEVSTSRTALVSEDEPHWQRYMAFAREFGIPEDLVLVAKSDDPAAIHAFLDDVAARLADDPRIAAIFHRVDLAAFESRAPLFLDEEALDQLARVAHRPELGALWKAEGPGPRLTALAALLEAVPDSLGPAVDPTETALLARVLEGVTAELARFSEGGAPPIRSPIDPASMASGAESRGRGIDAEGYLSARNGRVGIMFVRPTYTRDEIEVVEPFVRAVREAGDAARANHPNVWFGLTGIPASQIDELTTIAHDTVLTTAVALVGVVLLFLLYFPAFRLLLFALIPVGFGVVWTAAAIRLAFGYVNLMSSIFLVVLIGMGIDFSVHLASRFLEERRRGADPTEAAERAVARAGRGVVTGALTSAGAFLAVGWSGFRGIEELGIAASVGLVITLIFAMTILPAVLAWGGGAIDATKRRRFSIAPLVDMVLEKSGTVVIAACLITVPCLVWASRTPFDFSLLEMLPADAESAQLMAEMIDERELSADAVAIVAEDLEDARRIASRLAELDTVYSVVSAATFIPPRQTSRLVRIRSLTATLAATREVAVAPQGDVEDALDRMESVLERFSELAFAGDHKDAVNRLGASLDALERVRDRLEAAPEATSKHLEVFDAELARMLGLAGERLAAVVQAGPMKSEDLPDNLRGRFVSDAGRYAIYAVPKASIWDRPALGRFLEEVRAVDPDVTGFPETFYENAERIRQGFLRAALYAAIAVVLMLALDLGRLSHVASAMIPVGLGAVWMLGAMHLIDLPYNLANIVGLPLVIGVGIDNGVHIIHRFRESESVRLAAVETGSAVVLSSLTTMVGFGSLALASHRGYSSLGQILFIGVGACLVATLTVLLATLAPRRGGRR